VPVTLDERFWSRTRREGACLIWTGRPKASGYGQIRVAGRAFYVHRFIYEQRHGPIPAGLNVCHTCDNRMCIEDAHHFLGTQADNVHDCIAKGRRRPSRASRGVGSANPNAKLTEDSVRALRHALGAGETQTSIAARLGVTLAAINAIARGHTWKHVPLGPTHQEATLCL